MMNINLMLLVRFKIFFLLSFFCCFSKNSKAVIDNISFTVPIQTGYWKVHFNFNDIRLVHYFDNKIYAAANKGMFYLDLEDNSINKLSTINGLSNNAVSAMIDDGKSLIVGYTSGQIDFLSEFDIMHINLSFENFSVKINSFNIYENILYVSSSDGIFLVDIDTKQVLEHYSNIDNEISILNVISTKILNDSIYVLTKESVHYASLFGNNLLDFNSWNLLNITQNDLIGSFIYKNKIHVYSSFSMYNLMGDSINFELDNLIKKIKIVNGNLILTNGRKLYSIDNGNSLFEIYDSNKININDFIYAKNNYWIGLRNQGLYSMDLNYFFKVFNSPNIIFSRITKYANTLYGFTENDNYYSVFSDGLWENKNFENFRNITSVTEFDKGLFFGSETMGIFDEENNIIINDVTENSLLQKKINSNDVDVKALLSVLDKMWILNYGTRSPLISYNLKDGWFTYDFGVGSYQYPRDIIFNNSETFWITLDNKFGGGIILFSPYYNSYIKLTSASNFLPTNSINKIVIDKNDIVWVGTDDGLIYFPSSNIESFNNISTYLMPSNESGKILQNLKINTLLVDESNNKWIGTNQGVIILNSLGNKIEKEFTKENSSLISNNIIDISILDNGEIFFLTYDGLISYKSDNSPTRDNYNLFKAFPNPINLNEHHLVTFSGLMENNIIKITTLSGEEVISLSSIGGGTSWNLYDHSGSKVNEGIYLIFILSEDESEKLISKILIR